MVRPAAASSRSRGSEASTRAFGSAAAGEPGFLVAVLEFLMGDESRLLVFAERQRIRPTLIAAARFTLARTIEEA